MDAGFFALHLEAPRLTLISWSTQKENTGEIFLSRADFLLRRQQDNINVLS